jgi:hypothetical protein
LAEIDTAGLLELQSFVDEQYDRIASQDISHGQALYNIAEEAERLSNGDIGAAIRGMSRVVVGDDISRPRSGGEFWVEPKGRIQGASGFQSELQDESAQIMHAISGLFMASEYGSAGTLGALARELWTNILKSEFEGPDYLIYLQTERILKQVPMGQALLAPNGMNISGLPTSLAEGIRLHLLDDTVGHESDHPAAQLEGYMPSDQRAGRGYRQDISFDNSLENAVDQLLKQGLTPNLRDIGGSGSLGNDGPTYLVVPGNSGPPLLPNRGGGGDSWADRHGGGSPPPSQGNSGNHGNNGGTNANGPSHSGTNGGTASHPGTTGGSNGNSGPSHPGGSTGNSGNNSGPGGNRPPGDQHPPSNVGSNPSKGTMFSIALQRATRLRTLPFLTKASSPL